MKRLLFTLTLGLSLPTMAFPAFAATPAHGGTLPGITVRHEANLLRTVCRPPAYARACAGLHAQVRQAFSKREIALLFGAASALAEYRTNDASVRARYADFLRQIDANGSAQATAFVD
ncbi:MAG TPA: hypothetical protein PKC03_05540 [Dokdonella sp.]|jgi:hypothetical protein|nr:hypothetical protein [Dokdonella sp.]